MRASTRWFGWIVLISVCHMAEQLVLGLDELAKIKTALAGYYGLFNDADTATVLLATVGIGVVSLLLFAILVGGRSKFVALVTFNMIALTEIHHVIETIMAGRYTPGLITAIPYIACGVLFLRALIGERRAEKMPNSVRTDRSRVEAIA